MATIILRILALTSGAITLVLGMLSFIAGYAGTKPEHVSTVNIIAGVLFYICPSVLVAVGSYAYVLKRKVGGLVALFIGALLQVGFSSIFMFIECSMCLWWQTALDFLPGLTALATLLFSLTFQQFLSRTPRQRLTHTSNE